MPTATVKVSTTPWSNFSESDYTVQQWYRACLIHISSGPPTSKADCKLPVREPDGTLNRNGVYAAAAALSGARGGVNLTPSQMDEAKAALLKVYGQIGATPPHTLLKHSAVNAFFEHHGVKGQKWGVRRSRSQLAKGPSEDFTRAQSSLHKIKKGGTRSLSNHELKDLNNRLQLERQFSSIGPKSKLKKGSEFIAGVLATGVTINRVIEFTKSPAGSALASKLKK